MRRFGWSDISEDEAQSHADIRTAEALQRILAGESQRRRERKVPYNGADGVPIREEILARHGDAIVTRNGYGARCLNTPNVLFADIDFQIETGCLEQLGCGLGGALVAGFVANHFGLNPSLWMLFTVLAMILGALLPYLVRTGVRQALGGAVPQALRRVKTFVARHPDWNLRVYRTPAGLRIMAMNRTFDPGETAVAECFRALRVDRIYARMCLRQRCFRARVTAKPWRIGIAVRTRPGVWPVSEERIARRQAWIAEYETAAAAYSACQFLTEIGSGTRDRDAIFVQELHDTLCRATAELPLA